MQVPAGAEPRRGGGGQGQASVALCGGAGLGSRGACHTIECLMVMCMCRAQ